MKCEEFIKWVIARQLVYGQLETKWVYESFFNDISRDEILAKYGITKSKLSITKTAYKSRAVNFQCLYNVLKLFYTKNIKITPIFNNDYCIICKRNFGESRKIIHVMQKHEKIVDKYYQKLRKKVA